MPIGWIITIVYSILIATPLGKPLLAVMAMAIAAFTHPLLPPLLPVFGEAAGPLLFALPFVLCGFAATGLAWADAKPEQRAGRAINVGLMWIIALASTALGAVLFST